MTPNGSAPLVRVNRLVVAYRNWFRRVPVLNGASMTAHSGEITAVVGRNGAGKTTLFLALLGFLRPDAGDCLVGDLAPGAYRRLHGAGYLPESPSFPHGWTCRDLLARSIDLVGRSGDRESEFARAVVRSGLDTATVAKREHKCSMGTRRRISFACALVGDPKFLVLDEPFSGLDLPACKAMRNEMRTARSRGATVLFASHRLSEVERLADRVFVLTDGAVEPLASFNSKDGQGWSGLEAELEGRL